MPFGVATVLTNKQRAIVADRFKQTPSTYTTSAHFIAIGTGATAAARTAAATDAALSNEVETRSAGAESTITTALTGDTWQVSGSITATASRSVDEGGLFDSATSGAGNMAVSWTQNVDSLNSGDSITYTIKIQWL